MKAYEYLDDRQRQRLKAMYMAGYDYEYIATYMGHDLIAITPEVIEAMCDQLFYKRD